ncbi:MAG: metallophosphoesterase [Rhizobiales bacterium]|nr:metallophosphoesterase [Hyphomicrobiales bacterium]
MFVLAHLSDIHLAPLPRPRPLELMSKRGLGYINWLRKRHRIHRADMLAKVVADIKARTPDHVAVTGDLVNLSLTTEFAPARAFLERLGNTETVTAVPGNHDAYVRSAAGFALRDWGDYMRGDAGEVFPFVRRRGPLALIGLSTSLPTFPLAATGRLHGDQLARLGDVLERLGQEQAFRVVLIHHPPVEGDNYFRRLKDATEVRDILRRHGAELVLHGHHHVRSVTWLPGPQGHIPIIGVPSASGAPGHHDDPAGYKLYEIDGAPGAWRCTLAARGWDAGDARITEIERQPLLG